MIISDSKKFMYVHIYKTGGSSTTDLLLPYVDKKFRKVITKTEGLNWQQTWHLGKQHATLAESLPKLESMEVNPEDYFLFTFVRNPYAWILSVWNNFYRLPFSDQSESVLGSIKFIVKNILKNQTQDLLQNHTFREKYPNASFKSFLLFIDEIAKTGSDREKGFWGVYDQYSFLENDRNLEFDFIGKLENLEEDMTYLADKLDLPEYSEIPHRTFKDNKVARKKYLDYYDHESIEIANKLFARDFEMFEYTKVEPSYSSNINLT